MNAITLSQILLLVGTLDDTPGENTARERFRSYLKSNVTEVGQIRDYIEECLRTTGSQYARALQDLVNHLGSFLEFDVMFGRYTGVHGQLGFDGLWTSPTGLRIVVEVKTTEVYAIKVATLLNYINDLVSEGQIPSDVETLGLYIVGRPDPELQQFQNAIVAERRTDRLRIASAESLLSLAELMDEYGISHQDALALIRPSTPTIDPIIDLIASLVGEEKKTPTEPAVIIETPMSSAPVIPSQQPTRAAAAQNISAPADRPMYWLTPLRAFPGDSVEDRIARLVGREQVYAFSEFAAKKNHVKPGDRICFYASGKGIVAHATIASTPERQPHPAIHQSDEFPWTFKLIEPKLYLDDPVIIGVEMRAKLEAFQGRDPNAPWGWFVVSTAKLKENDFKLLTRGAEKVTTTT